MTLEHVSNVSGDCTQVLHGDGLPPSIALSLSSTFWCRPLCLVGRRVWVATALVLFTLALSGVVAAQAAIQVSNLGQAMDTTTMNASWDAEVQGFRTGTHQAGYSLTSVQLHVDSFVAPATIADMTIKLRPGSQYDADVLTFSNPTFTSAGTVTFTLPTGTTFDLTPETVYFVVIDINNADGDSGVNLGTTTVTDEDSGAAAGWEIYDDSHWLSGGVDWLGNGYMYRIAVNASLKNTPATGLPTITGTATVVDDVLTAVTTGIADVDGLSSVSYSYQWIQVNDMAVETDISGETSSTYTLVAATVGKHFKVRVTFQDDRSFDESLTSKLYPARTGGICVRTEQVRDAIVAATTATTCANVTATHLTGVWPSLTLTGKAITSLKSGDFDGLTRLTSLYLNNNVLTSLPADIFDGLTALTRLEMRNNDLSSLPANIFNGLTALTRLDLQENTLSSLPAGLFTGLTALTDLYLGINTLSSLPAGLFTGLTALEELVLANNDTLSSLPAGLFTGLTTLDDLHLSYNALSSLPAGIFDGLTELDRLWLNRNALTSLPANVFQDLTTLTLLELHNNPNTDPFAPTAEAGEAQMVATGATVTLAGSSSGPWGTNVTYAWTQTSGTTVTLTGADTASPSFTAPSTAGDLVFTLTVKGRPAGARGTANSTDTVTVTVTDPRTLATLSDLTLSAGTLDPEFDTDTDTYTASVLNSVTTLTVTPTTTGSNATVAYLDNNDNTITDTDSNTPGLQVALAPNLAETMHVIKVKVTAETGTPQATKTYIVTVTKEASDIQLPGAPTGLTATPAAEPTQIDLSWTAPGNTGNSPITGYRIEVSTDGNAWTVLEEDTGDTDTTYAHTGLGLGVTRHYRVSARNVLGPGARSNTTSAMTLSGGICARTAQVRDAIVAATTATTCADVAPAHLASLENELDLTSKNITSLKPGDFAGFTNLFDLKLERNALTELPAGIFDPLTALTFLRLDGNALASLPPGIFDKLTALEFLDLSGNALTSLPPGIFDKLTALRTLFLADLGTLTILPPGIFDRLTALETLHLGNALTKLPARLFNRLTALTFLNLCDTLLTELELPSVLYDRFITIPPNPDLCLPDNVRVTREARRRPPPPPRRGGSSTPPAAPRGYLENPGADSFQSGIGVLSGWVCEGDEVEIEITTEGGEVARQVAAYGTERLDTQDACGDTDNGFGLLFNWNLLDDGVHAVVAYVDDEELDRATVTVTTLGSEFLRDVTGTCAVPDFPLPGETVTLEWQQNSQNFVIRAGPAPTGMNRAGSAGVGYLENPGPNSFQSGMGVLSGWVCAAEAVEIEITTEGGEVARQVAAYGTERLDTLDACGDTDNGFGLLFNWNLLGEGVHTVVAYVDGAELGRATVRVTTVGEGAEGEFLRGAEGECVVEDFPMPGETVTVEWQQNSQNFVITEVE